MLVIIILDSVRVRGFFRGFFEVDGLGGFIEVLCLGDFIEFL